MMLSSDSPERLTGANETPPKPAAHLRAGASLGKSVATSIYSSLRNPRARVFSLLLLLLGTLLLALLHARSLSDCTSVT
jgi:hypothetical protein